MKKLMGLLLLVCTVGVAWAQVPVEKTKKITRDEVPAAVLLSFERDFPSIAKGEWFVEYKEDLNGMKTVLRPSYYLYKGKNQEVKFEAVYSVSGKLEHSKGIQRAD